MISNDLPNIENCLYIGVSSLQLVIHYLISYQIEHIDLTVYTYIIYDLPVGMSHESMVIQNKNWLHVIKFHLVLGFDIYSIQTFPNIYILIFIVNMALYVYKNIFHH